MYVQLLQLIPTDLYLVRLHCLSLMSALLTPSMRACMPSMHTASSPPLLHHAGRRGLLLCYERGTVAIVSPPSLPPI